MLHIQHIDSLDRPELAPYRTMRRQAEHRQLGIFVAEGEKVVRRLLESEFAVLSLLLPEKWFHEYEPLLQRRAEDITVFIAQKDELEKLTGFSMYQGVLAVGRIPKLLTVSQILTVSPTPRLLVAADGLSSAENLGALVRNCAAFGAQGLLVGETCTSPYLRRAVRNSMGAIFKLPVTEVSDLATTLRELSGRQIRCLAAHPHAERRSLAEANLAHDCCLVFGSEGYGISDRVLTACDEAVAVPMQLEVDSLNVGSAAAVFLYEASRQRGRV